MEGGEALAQGFLRGVTGLVQRPLQGAAQAGVGGAPLTGGPLSRGVLLSAINEKGWRGPVIGCLVARLSALWSDCCRALSLASAARTFLCYALSRT